VSDDPLDLANRFVVAVLALIVAFGGALVILLAWGAAGASIGRVEDFAGFLRDHDDRDSKIIVTMGGLVVILLMTAAIIIESTPSPLQRMRLRNLKSGEGVITTVEIARRIEQEVRGVRHVRDCAATVAARNNAVEVALDLHVDGAADLAQTADEACRRAHELVERQVGVRLAKRPRARMHYRELRLKDEPPARTPAPDEHVITGWERPTRPEELHDDRGDADTPEEAQA
jgi:hypothetical protein